ncbi:hypothetical protein DL764_001444 [Monosporascus ibericus]|uniref:Mus7/MMS22 family-domain-containing protein n=1 Tax=Monosporascus ibericus TaxID=155417 RepID=A0A4Q4TUJ2_9PEZI|nr:hypothetical protein DL764_001444 [Monosporascus ibericus]
MAKWKELGEVPDSEDESALNSQESQQELPLPVPNLRDDGTTDDPYEAGRLASQDRDVWDIPPSSSQPDQVKDVPGESSNHEPPPASTPPSPHSSPPEQRPDEVDVAPTASPQTQDRAEQTVGAENETSSIPRADPTIQSVDSIFEVVDVPAEDREVVPEAMPYSRSLRPRKPIQEHPYLLESAQYSKVLKSHGIRPMKVRIEEAARRRQEEDSQEQDYEDDSQLTAKDLSVEESGESQVLDKPGLFDDLDELALSPPRPSSSPPEDTRIGDLIRSSQADEEEFPDPADVAKWKTLGAPRITSKRRTSPKMSAKRKVLKRHAPDKSTGALSPLSRRIDVFEIPPSPPQTSPALFLTTPMTNPAGRRPITALTPKPSSVFSSRNQSPAPANQNSRLIDLTMQDDRSSDSDEGDEVPGSSPENEADVLLQNSRRIRGVLPASWLRLDQQTTRLPPKRPDTRRSLERSPERSHRKGVAQRRQVSPKPNIDNPFFFNDSDSDNDETNLRLDETNDFVNNSTFPIFEDDGGSAVEEDHIDRMLPGGKRTSRGAHGQERPRKKRKGEQSTFKEQRGQRKRQQRITGLLGRTKSTSSTGHGRQDGHTSASYTKKSTTTRIRPSTPPRLSILDLAEPDAPAFIRIAARAARQRPGKGRSSPTMKRISLGTRQDHVEVTGVLRDWRRGNIQPKLSVNDVDMRHHADDSPTLQPVSHNPVVRTPRRPGKVRVRRVIPSSRFSRPVRLAKQSSMDNFLSVETETVPGSTDPENAEPQSSRQPTFNRPQKLDSTSRPAQLETAGENVSRYAFTTRKKALDALYRKSHKALLAPVNLRLDRILERNAPANDTHQGTKDVLAEKDPKAAASVTRRRLKSRKHLRPRRLDTSAPQYAHANDPLPREASPIFDVVDVPEDNTKLLGLGPFGTHYTQHFEVFPLDPGVFFHESTLLGSGRLVKAVESSLDSLNRMHGRSIFVLDEKNLQWGPWDAQTSSELGILCDWIVERLSSEDTLEELPRSAGRAALFILEYLQDSLSFPDQPSQRAFAHRALEVLQSYSQRLEALAAISSQTSNILTQVLGCCILTVFQVLRICQKFDMMSECFKLEELLKNVAKHTCKRLLHTDLTDIRLLFGDLQRMSYRERGIRDDQHSAVCWVVLIRVLEEARIPRSGFWDVLSPVMLKADASSIVDAHDFERLWCNLFTLLPLGEFDNSGLLAPGIRHTRPLEGWWLPQKLLGRIFQLYKSNSRQSPSFNDYCRGLYVKEKDMHETELAALRNHHDLLCTLFWAAPPDLRPSIQLIEKLVVPGSSHKEACLVNLRAWNQLARYIVSSGEDVSAYKPFGDWQKTVFKQVLDQYSSAESDIQQQFLRMSKDASRTISQDLMNSVIKANKRASLDVLHFSMKTVLDVMRHTPTLAATSFVVRHYQLDQIFTRFTSSSADFDWSSLRVGVDIIDFYTRRIEEFLCRQPEQLDSETSWHGEDAILRINQFFSPGKFHVFEGLPKGIAGPSRKFLPLFLATLIRKGVFEFKDLGVTTLELFLCAITKPFQYTAYENRLAEAMKRQDDPYLIDAFIDVGGSPDYHSNRDLFSHIISKMRKSLRFAEAGQKPQLQAQFAKALRAVMEQIKQDLKLMIASPPEHSNYIDFVRDIVALIRSHDICPVDPYYYQISPEYSPSRQDPRLQTAGILACGLKLEEGNPRAASGLFYLLWPNFTTALANGKLADECAILEQGMRHSHVFSFMLGKMFPAIVRTAARRPEGWVLMETYVGALEKWMAGPAVHKEIAEENMENVLALLKSADASVRHLKGLDITDLHPEHLYSLIYVLKLLNLLAPSLDAYLINEPTSPEAGEITKTIDVLTGFTGAAGSYISALLDERPQPRAEAAAASGPREHQPSFTLNPTRLFEGILQSPSHDQQLDSPDPEPNDFSAYMVRDIGNTWAIITSPSSNVNSGPTMAALTVRGPARPSATQSGQGTGTLIPGWGAKTLAKQLREQARRWNSMWVLADAAGEMADMGSSGGGRWEERCAALDDCLF